MRLGKTNISQKTLVVDDDKVIRELLVITLEDAGYAVCTASEGYEAIQQYRIEPPDSLISDLNMH